MTVRKHANNVTTSLASGISNIATTMTVSSATGFPAIGVGETWRATITDGTNFEIVECTDDNSSPVMTITRGMESTAARTWSSGALVIIMATADSFDRKWDKAETSATGLGILDTDGALTANSDAKVPSQKAVKTYTDSIYGFKTISVSGQSDVVADSATDTLTLAAGSNITLTTNASTDTVTITASGGGGSSIFFPFRTQATTVSLTNSDNCYQEFTGSGGYNVNLPVATTMTAGQGFLITNEQSSGNISVFTSGGNSLLTIPTNCFAWVHCVNTAGGTGTASWKARIGISATTVSGTGSILLRDNGGTLQNYNIGTPASGTLTNCTNLPLSGLQGFATTRKMVVSNGTSWVASTETWAVPGTAGNVLVSDGTNWTSVARKLMVQTVFTTTGTMATGTTTMPLDNTTPQITEGDEYMTLAITPTNSSNVLEIEVLAYINNSALEGTQFALFQDSTANCLKSGFTFLASAANGPCIIKHRMTAGTTSSTTFRFRAGRQSSGTLTFNGYTSAAYLNGTICSYIKITEYTV